MASIDIASLSPAERLALISELWDSLAEAGAPLSPAQGEELVRRLSMFETDKRRAVAWDALKADLGAREP